MDDLLTWIETHKVTIGIIQWAVLLIIAWLSGLFRLIWKNTIKPKLEIVPTASIIFYEEIQDEIYTNPVRASFIIYANLVNRTNEKIVLQDFYLSFESENFWRSYKQKLLSVTFPARPRKIVGTGIKFMNVFFTEYPEEEVKLKAESGKLETKEMASGYVLFVSSTYGNWNPKIRDGYIRVKLHGILTNGETNTNKAPIRITQSKEIIDELVPGLVQHVAHESTWGYDLSIVE